MERGILRNTSHDINDTCSINMYKARRTYPQSITGNLIYYPHKPAVPLIRAAEQLYPPPSRKIDNRQKAIL